MRGTDLHAIALVNGNGGHHASDLDLDPGAVNQLAGGNQILKQDAQPLAGVHRQRIYFALHLQQGGLDAVKPADDALPTASSPSLA